MENFLMPRILESTSTYDSLKTLCLNWEKNKTKPAESDQHVRIAHLENQIRNLKKGKGKGKGKKGDRNKTHKADDKHEKKAFVPVSERRCYRCGQAGHYKSACTQKPKQG